MKNQTLLLFLTILLSFVFHSLLNADTNINKNATNIYYIHLSEEIQPAAGRLIKKAFQAAEQSNADQILLEINTYGGRLDVADSIRTRILNSKIPTIAFINNNAASAGALISLACDKIFMAPGSSIGAATVVNGNSGEAMPDKYQSYMRSMMRSTAETKGRNPDIAEAMVDERIVIKGISDSGKVLTLTSKEALKYYIADNIADDIKQVLSEMNINNYNIVKHQVTATDSVINFLLNPLVNSILILIIIGGLYFEFKTPGLGVFILASLTAAILYFAPLIIDGTANIWEILLFAIGVILLLLEIFIIPGFGVTGIAGIICIVAGLTFSLVNFNGFDFEFNFITGDLLSRSFFRVMAIISFAFIVIFFFGESLINLPGFNKLVLKSEQFSDKGFSTRQDELYQLIGKEGIVINPLRPTGKINIDGNIYEAISNAHYIDKDTIVTVQSINGYSLIVSAKA
ncbi:MAG: ATP-dependent Clp protease proteolytic subunit [Chitinophagales bacterium]|nr:ATP-dependent Clp protease proteolytic subunit [Chitinophagales bacterium]